MTGMQANPDPNAVVRSLIDPRRVARCMVEQRETGVANPVRLSGALDRLRESVTPVDRSERIPVTGAVGRVLAEAVECRSSDDRSESAGAVLTAGRRLRESDLAVCRALGRTRVEVTARPTVGVVPTRLRPVDDGNPAEPSVPNELTVASLTERWGGKPTQRDPFESDRHAVRAAVERDLTKDLVVLVDGSVDDDRELVRGVVDDLGEITVEGISLDPGRHAALGVVRKTPVVVLPGDPIAAFVAAVTLVRPAVARAGRLPVVDHPETGARLGSAIESSAGVRTVTPVSVGADGADGVDGSDVERIARPLRRDDGSALATLATTDGWVTVPGSRERIPAGETVAVADWEVQP